MMQITLYMANSERGKAIKYKAIGRKAAEIIKGILEDKILNEREGK